jgi:NADH:ubiquinone oxidoreductase subunit 4 (subunit M)
MADLLVITVLLPLAMALMGVTVPKFSGRLFRLIAQATTGLTFIASLVLFAQLDRAQPGVQLVSVHPWLGQKLQFTLGLDGVSALGFVLAALCEGLDLVFVRGLGVGGVSGVARLAGWCVRQLQGGYLRFYLLFTILGIAAVLIWMGR